MYGDIGAPFFDRHFKLLDEQALAANLRERLVENLVALGGHGDDLDRRAGIKLPQFRRRPFALHHGEAALTRGNAKAGGGAGMAENGGGHAHET